MKKRNRILAMLLTAILTLSMLPSEAFATEAIDTGETAAAAVEEVVSSVGEEQDVEATVEEIATVEEAAEETEEAEEAVTEEAVAEEAADPVAEQEDEEVAEETAEADEAVTEEEVTEEAADPVAVQEDEEAAEDVADPAEVEEIAEPAAEAEAETVPEEAAKAVEWPITLEYRGSDYTITATFDESAGFPADVKLNVSEIRKGSDAYQYYYDQALETVQNETDKEVELTDARFFDITFSTEEGEVEPTGPVNVSIKYRKAIEAESSDDVHVLHFDDNDDAAPQIMDIETDGRGDKVNEVSFETDGFSVYAVIGTGETGDEARATVNFIGANENTIATVYVKKSDSLDDLETIVYDPGAGTLDDGYAFYGWTLDKDYTAKTTGKTIAEVRKDLEALDITEGDVVNYYAIILTQYTVEYLNSAGIVSVGSGSALVRKVGDEVSYKVSMGYPTDDTHNFLGWQVTEGLANITDPSDITAATIIKNDTEIKIKGNITLKADAPEGHWLVFDENGKGATYNAPRFFETNEVTSDDKVLEMKRKGYTFGGWYTDAACSDGNKFTFGDYLTEKTTIYAKWTPIATADYTVLIWKQNLNADGYDFETSKQLNGTVGSTVNTVTQQGTGDNAYARIDGTDYRYTGFHLDHFDQNVEIVPEGNAVVNVYYNRTSYTLTFRRYESSGTVYKTITALYGQYIGDNFPISVNGDTTYRWEPHNSSTFKQVLVFIDVMPAENVTFSRDYKNVSTKYMEFYVEALPGQTADRTWDGKSFVKYGNTIPAQYSFFTEDEDFVTLIGYDKYGSDPAFDSNGEAHVNGGETIYFYYTRTEFNLIFTDGAYYDGNGNRIADETSLGVFNELTVSGIAYQADLTSYNKDGANYKTPTGKGGYIFEGWYIDDACTQAYTFSTMPGANLTVYAKWRQIQYRVFLHPNAGDIDHEDPTLEWGSETQEMNFRVTYGGEVSTPEGKRTGYEFYGWYFDEGLSAVYPDSFKLHDDNTTYGQYFSEYDKTKDFTDPMDQWGNGATTNNDTERFWITKKLDIYARWSKVTVGADGINVVYDANGGTNAPTDGLTYKDNSSAAAGAASTPAEGKVFKHWVVQAWDGSNYVNTDPLVTVLPGETYTIHVEDAKIIDENGNVVALADVTKDHEYTYTIQLRAEYTDVEEKTPTHIPWFKNDGTAAFHIDIVQDGQGAANSTLAINQAVEVQDALERGVNYTFLGWARVEMTGNPADWEGNDGNWTQNLTAANLFLYYDAESGKFYTDSGFTKEADYVAADESEPYHAMFAVWDKIPGYFVYNSVTGEGKDPVFYEMPKEGDPDPDLTELVADGYLYGGYYHYELDESGNPVKGDAYTDSGMHLKPVDDTVYYLKEVPNTYLRPQIYLIYNTVHNGLIQGLYGFVNVDSDSDYNSRGLIVDGADLGNIETLVSEDIVITKGEKTYATLNKSNLFNMGSVDCYIGVVNLTDYIKLGGDPVQIGGYYVTKDGIKVTGYKDRLIQFDSNNEYGYNAPIFTGWTSQGGNTRTGLRTVGSKTTEITQSTGNRVAVTRMLMLSAPSDKIEYKITKVYDSNTEEQTVEKGDYTGQITYASKDGYMFAGWYQDEALIVPADFSNVTGDMTVYAKYVSNKDITVAFSKKSQKSNTTTFNATISVKNRDLLENVTVNVNNYISSVLANKSVKKTGTGKNIKYTTQYKGTVAVKGLATRDTFTASVSWTTPDGTLVTGTNRNCTYNYGIVTVK